MLNVYAIILGVAGPRTLPEKWLMSKWVFYQFVSTWYVPPGTKITSPFRSIPKV